MKKKHPYALQWYMNTSLIPTMLICWVTLCYIAFLSISTVMNTRAQEGIRYGMAQRMLVLNERLSAMQAATDSMLATVNEHAYAYLHGNSYYRRNEARVDMQAVVDSIAQWNPNIGGLYVFDLDQMRTVVGTGHIFHEDVVKLVEELSPVSSFQEYRVLCPFLWEDQYRLAICMELSVGTVNHRNHLLVLVVGQAPLEVILEQAEDENQSNLMSLGVSSITDKDGIILYGGTKEEDAVVITMPPNTWGLSLRYEINRSIYYKDRTETMRVMVGVLLLGMMLTLAVIALLVNRLNRPLRRMTEAIEQIRLRHSPEPFAGMELGVKEYDMIMQHTLQAGEQIQQDMRDMMRIEEEKHVQETMMLRMQINPHFLYNALNAVQWMTRMGNTKDVESYVKALVHILHYNLDNPGKNTVLLPEEIVLLKNYVEMHRYRYDSHIELMVTGETDMQALVPRFILQPIVENAIYHGLRNDSGVIELVVAREGEKLCLTVRDNGCGISDEVMAQLRSQNQRGMGIGLRYVNAVLRDLPDGKMTLQNIIREGTICGTEAILTMRYMPAPKEYSESPSSC